MHFQAIFDRLTAISAPGLGEADIPRAKDPEDKKDLGRAGDSYVWVDAQKLAAFLEVCRDDEQLGFEMVADLTATDPDKDGPDLWVNVQLISIAHKHRLAIKCLLPKDNAAMPTSVPVHRTCQWHERECAEMFGITFTGHPDPRNILLPDDWVGYPLRKDFEFPEEYHGISCK
ncbi:MAG: NADH-quinone oxidoreductase subunit C [Planctomycetota bacterium]|jgi:NADH-quinone oxidoreductase subunit C